MIIICGSISASIDIKKVQKFLEEHGHEVEIPEGVKNPNAFGRIDVSDEEKASDKIKGDLIRGYYRKIETSEAVLIVNAEKRGIAGYIGGNTLIEMAFGHVLGKPLYVLNPLPDLSYTSELLAMKPTVIHGDLSLIKTYGG